MTVKTKPKYAIQTLTPANGFSAVWSHDHGGDVQVEIRPLDFIAVANAQHFQNGKWIDGESEIVGVDLAEGFFLPITELNNCHGIVRDGTSWAECLDLLPSELASRVVNRE